MRDVTWANKPNGDLLIVWNAEARMETLAWETFQAYGLTAFLLEPEEIESAGVALALQNNPYDAFLDILEPLITDDSYEWVAPYQIGALTDGPLLGYDVRFADEGSGIDIESVDKVYYYNDYQLRSPMEDLIIYGQVTFNLAAE